jgi:drug/metabolite transporter (DMT)-like permease
MAGLGAACISSSAILVQLADVGAATTAFFRCLLALPLLIALAAAERRSRGPQPLATRLQAAGAGLFLAIDLVLWNHAITDVGAGIATVLGNLQVLFVALIAWLVLGERPQRGFLVMLPVIMLGVVLVSGMLGQAGHGHDPAGGIGYGIGTSLAYAAFLLLLRRAASGRPHVAGKLADATAGAAAGALLIGLAFGGLDLHVSPRALGWLAVLAVTSQTIGWLLITSALPRLPAAISSVLLLLQPAAALGLAAVVLGERPAPIQLVGAVLICGGVVAVSRTARSAAAQPAPAQQASA